MLFPLEKDFQNLMFLIVTLGKLTESVAILFAILKYQFLDFEDAAHFEQSLNQPHRNLFEQIRTVK